jgi:pimeloyl-ACP methyl ester carboxylesterase
MPTLHLEDTDLAYEVVGKGEPLLFIHGLGSRGSDWEPQVGHFADRYQVIVFDVRGHGDSGKPPGPYSIRLFAADTVRLLNKLGLGPAHVAGISMGGMIGLQLAVDYPEVVRSLVVVNCGAELVVRDLKQRVQVWQRFVIVRLLGMRKMGEVLSERLFPKPEQEPLREVFVERWARNEPRAYQEAMRAIVGWSVVDRLREVGCPTLVVASDNDYTPVAEKQAIVDRIPGAALVVIEDARHAVTVEKPEHFNAVLDGFLAGTQMKTRRRRRG